MTTNASVEFFDQQFRQQVARRELALNPFEAAALPHLQGSVLDFGCGLGNLALTAARRGSRVLALDASESAIQHLGSAARLENLPLHAEMADLRDYELQTDFDSVVCIGLLMFFDCAAARRQLQQLKSRVKPGGVAAVNVLIEGTTFLDMFSAEGHCLFGADELLQAFDGWAVLHNERSRFAAPHQTSKHFSTVVARRPGLRA